MKILVVCQHYWPEPFPLTDVCEELVRLGHDVHVVTDIPNYPMGYIYPDYKKGQNRKQIHNDVRISRTFTIGRRNNILFRILNYFSYMISSTIFVNGLKEEYDVVFANQSSPVMMANAALSYARKHKKKCVLYCMDLWPASLAMGGIREGSALYRFFGWISGKIYRRADRILITSQMFRSYFREEFGIADETIGYLPQYASGAFDRELPEKTNTDTVDLLFAGNVGVAQSLDTVLQAAAILKDQQALRWHIVGDGSELERLKQIASDEKLDQVIFHGRKPQEQMPEYYAGADAMLVTLTDDPNVSRTLPAKVQSYMAAGKPIIAAANGEIPNVIRDADCGFCAAAGDAAGLADSVRKFLNLPDRKQLGTRAKAYYRSHFTKDKFMNTLIAEFENARNDK